MEKKETRFNQETLEAIEAYRKTIRLHIWAQWTTLSSILFFAVACAVVYL